MVPRIEHLSWLVGRHDAARHDLATSDLDAAAGDWHVEPESLADRADPPSDLTIEQQLATIYGVGTESVLVTAGATHANFLAFAALIDHGDHVLVETPGYEPLRGTPAWLGAEIDRYERPASADYALLSERILEARGPDTSLVVATNRHNPSGKRTDPESLAVAALVAGDAGGKLLVDEVYAPYCVAPGDGPFGGPSAAGLADTIVTSSLTKAFGLGGLRVGWIIADPSVIERARDVFAHVPVLSTPGQALARRALYHREDLLSRSRELILKNHDLLWTFVAERGDLDGPVFDGATYAFLAHGSADGDEVVEAAWEAGILVTPGRFFEDSDRFRLSLGHDPDEMQAALDAFGDVLDGL